MRRSRVSSWRPREIADEKNVIRTASKNADVDGRGRETR